MSTVHFSDNDLAEAVQALSGIVRKIEHVNQRAMVVIIATSDGQRFVSLGEQNTEGLTFADLLDGHLAEHDFGEVDLFHDPRALPFHQSLARLERALQGYRSRHPERSTVAIVRTRAAANSPDQPNGPSAGWRRFDGGTVSDDLRDIELLGAVNLQGGSSACSSAPLRRST
jgi:hypothetical protein